MSKTPHVALLIETSRSFTRDLLAGIRRYMSEHGNWSVYMELRALESRVPPWLKNWRGDGIIARSNSQAMVDTVLETGLPAVELRATTLRHDLPFIGVDNRAMGQMVVEHLRERGFRRFGVYALETEDYFKERVDNFVETVEAAGHECHVYRAGGRRERPLSWEQNQQELTDWVAGLPKPIGILACTDQLGFWLLDACTRAGASVPEEVAVVGAENDESLCTMSSPPLSSVQFNGRRNGYEAAALLARLMKGESPPDETLYIPPLGIVTRQSSDVVAIEDEDLAAALRFIRENACKGIAVDDVVARLAMSRSALERRIRQQLDRTVQAEIIRIKLNRVKELLVDTNLPLAAVARKAGFRHPQYMAEVFRRELGQTPGAFRTASRG